MQQRCLTKEDQNAASPPSTTPIWLQACVLDRLSKFSLKGKNSDSLAPAHQGGGAGNRLELIILFTHHSILLFTLNDLLFFHSVSIILSGGQ